LLIAPATSPEFLSLTIHFYIREGLLRNPHKSGMSIADYNENHVNQIRFIKELRDHYYFPIPLIRKIIRKVKKQTASEWPFFNFTAFIFVRQDSCSLKKSLQRILTKSRTSFMSLSAFFLSSVS
jgi:DNA-binding transcriptional MerR regulator